MRAAAVAALAGAVSVAGHGQILSPPSRGNFNIRGSMDGSAGTCAGGSCYWFNEGCNVGCDKCGKIADCGKGSVACCGKQGKATLPDYARTFKYRGSPSSDDVQKDCGTTPWCSPGAAPVRSPCGVAGGSDELDPSNPGSTIGNSGWVPDGAKLNQDGRTLPELKGVKTVWKAGGVVNISWSINANHGGGYQYRLCKKSAMPTEACFQATPMKFASSTNYVQYCTQSQQLPQQCCSSSCPAGKAAKCNTEYRPCNGTSISFPAVDVSTGTTPQGSTWRRNPIPPCKGGGGGCCAQACGKNRGHSADDYQFTPPARDLSRPTANPTGIFKYRYDWLGGFGAGGGCDTPGAKWQVYFSYNIVDEVAVPDVPPGDYVMSWRWDVEQGTQIWSSCSDVTIE